MIARTLAATLMLAGAAEAADRALVIGIDDYAAVQDAASLNGAVRDADRMAAALTGTLGFAEQAVIRLSDAEATADAILTALIDRLVRETGADDRVLLYFAGHGTVQTDGAPALVAHDGDSVLGRIPLATISEILGVIADRKITVILDSGFDGGPPGTRGLPGAVQGEPVSMGPKVTLWTAAAMGQFAWETLDRGVFTQAFLDGLAHGDADGDGRVTNAEMLTHAQTRMAEWCDGHAPCAVTGRDLAPGFAGDADAVLLTRAAALPKEEPLDPIIADDGAPAGYRETLGFVTDLFAPSNAAGLRLAIGGGGPLRVGGHVTFTAEADRPGALLLLDVDPEGRLAQVYPSRLAAEGGTRLTPGRPLTIPSALGVNGKPLRIRVTEPAGQGLLLALFIEGDLPDLTAVLPAGIEGGPVPNAGQSLFEISQALLRLEADPDRPVSWSATYLPYRIDR